MESNVIIDYSKLLGDICTDIFSYIQPYAIWMVAILIVVCGVTFMLLRSWSRALLVALFAVYMFMVVVITILSREPHLDIYTVKLRSFETFTGSYNSNIFFAFSAGLLCSFGIEYTQYYTDKGSFEVDEGVYEEGSEYFLLQEGG